MTFNRTRKSVLFLCLAALLSLPGITDCKRQEIYVVVDGKKYTESDLAGSPAYEELKQNFRSLTLDLLREKALDRMVELEAKSEGLTPDEYKRKFLEYTPAEDDVRAKFDELKARGFFPGRTYPEVRETLSQGLKEQEEVGRYERVMSRLEKKYGFEDSGLPGPDALAKADGEPKKTPEGNEPANTKTPTIEIKSEPSRGNTSARITIVEFTDFLCSYCQRARSTLKKLEEKYGEKLRWVVKDTPFIEGSMQAHVAANCVYRQSPGAYWKYFETLFSPFRTADNFEEKGLLAVAGKLGVDIPRLKQCLKDPTVSGEILKDLEEGVQLEVTGTPTFFINGTMLVGAQPLDKFTEIIDAKLKN